MNAVVRGDVHWIRIGARSNVQDGTVVHVMNGTHPTTIGAMSRSGTPLWCMAARSVTGC